MKLTGAVFLHVTNMKKVDGSANLSEQVESLIHCFNNPRRPNLEAALKAINGSTSSVSIWDELQHAKLLPEDLIQDARRMYRSSPPEDVVGYRNYPRFNTPSTLLGALTIAADPAGIMAAERHSRELVSSLAPWRPICSDEIEWGFISHIPDYIVFLGNAVEAACDTVELSLDQYGLDYHLIDEDSQIPLPILIRNILNSWQCWQIATEKNLDICGPRWPFDYTIGESRRFSDLGNPFTPLLDLWRTGYIIGSQFSNNDPKIRLYANQVLIKCP